MRILWCFFVVLELDSPCPHSFYMNDVLTGSPKMPFAPGGPVGP